MSLTSSPSAAPARAITLAQHVLREKLDKWPDLKKHEQLFNLILARTADPETAELKDLLPDPDERTIRRRVQAMNAILRAGFAAAGCIYALQAVEGQPGHQSESQKKERNTFTIVANRDLQKPSYRKWWTGVFANSLNAQAYPLTLVYPVCCDSSTGAATVSFGTVQILKHLSRSFLLNGIDMADADSETFHCDDLREPGRNLIFIGGAQQNRHVAELHIPESLELEWDTEDRKIVGGKTEGGKDVEFPDATNAGPRAVHVLVTCFSPAWMDDARIWVFEAQEDRAYEAMGLFFSSDENLETLAVKLGVKASEEFPERLQLAFRVHLNAKGQLRNGTGDVVLAGYFGGAATPPTPGSPSIPKRPNNLQGSKEAKLHIAASGGLRT